MSAAPHDDRQQNAVTSPRQPRLQVVTRSFLKQLADEACGGSSNAGLAEPAHRSSEHASAPTEQQSASTRRAWNERHGASPWPTSAAAGGQGPAQPVVSASHRGPATSASRLGKSLWLASAAAAGQGPMPPTNPLPAGRQPLDFGPPLTYPCAHSKGAAVLPGRMAATVMAVDAAVAPPLHAAGPSAQHEGPGPPQACQAGLGAVLEPQSVGQQGTSPVPTTALTPPGNPSLLRRLFAEQLFDDSGGDEGGGATVEEGGEEGQRGRLEGLTGCHGQEPLNSGGQRPGNRPFPLASTCPAGEQFQRLEGTTPGGLLGGYVELEQGLAVSETAGVQAGVTTPMGRFGVQQAMPGLQGPVGYAAQASVQAPTFSTPAKAPGHDQPSRAASGLSTLLTTPVHTPLATSVHSLQPSRLAFASVPPPAAPGRTPQPSRAAAALLTSEAVAAAQGRTSHGIPPDPAAATPTAAQNRSPPATPELRHPHPDAAAEQVVMHASSASLGHVVGPTGTGPTTGRPAAAPAAHGIMTPEALQPNAFSTPVPLRTPAGGPRSFRSPARPALSAAKPSAALAAAAGAAARLASRSRAQPLAAGHGSRGAAASHASATGEVAPAVTPGRRPNLLSELLEPRTPLEAVRKLGPGPGGPAADPLTLLSGQKSAQRGLLAALPAPTPEVAAGAGGGERLAGRLQRLLQQAKQQQEALEAGQLEGGEVLTVLECGYEAHLAKVSCSCAHTVSPTGRVLLLLQSRIAMGLNLVPACCLRMYAPWHLLQLPCHPHPVVTSHLISPM